MMTPTTHFRYRLRHPSTRVDRAKAVDELGAVVIWERDIDESALQFRTSVTDDSVAKSWRRVVFYASREPDPSDD